MGDTIDAVSACYYLASYLFILSLSGLSNQETARRGNWYGIFGMFIAIFMTFFLPQVSYEDIGRFSIAFIPAAFIGLFMAFKVQMISMPQMVAALHSFVGLAAVLVGYSSYLKADDTSTENNLECYIGIFIGCVTVTGSVVAWGKLSEKITSQPLILLPGSLRHILNLVIILVCVAFAVVYSLDREFWSLISMTALASFLGWHLVMAIGGADMPVVVSMLNSYSGWATSASGFTLDNELLIISGALIGSSGAILSYIMCKAMNRSFFSVISGGFGIEAPQQQAFAPEGQMVEAKSDEVAAELLKAKSVIIVPGYGMAVSRAQNAVGQLAESLIKLGIKTRFCIHPVAGRLPGHMNVLLAEANVQYELVHEMDDINKDFSLTDVVIVIGANDIVNPDALENPTSPIAGMPICHVWNAKKTFVIKRGKGMGYAAIENPLFFKKNTRMFYGSADQKVKELLQIILQNKEGQPQINVKQIEEKKLIEQQGDQQEDELDNDKIVELKNKCVRCICVPKECWQDEKRVAIVPKTVKKLLQLGFQVLVEQGAGQECGYPDDLYIRNGAEIVSAQQVWQQQDILIKIRPPIFNIHINRHESDILQANVLISQIYAAQNKETVDKLLAKQENNLFVLALDQTPRITRAQKLDTLSSMTNLAGYRAVLEGFSNLPRFSKQQITAAGKFAPAQVFIIGAGVAGLAAIGLAKGMGAIVRAFDSRQAAKEQVQSLGAEFVEMDYVESGEGQGGYGKEMSQEYYKHQKLMTQKEARRSDVIITTALIPGKRAPTLLHEDTVRMMKPGSVVVDMAAEMGGNCELTKPGKVYLDQVSGVTIVGYTDLPSRMAMQASEMFSQNMYNLIEELIDLPKNPNNTAKNFNLNYDDEIIRGMTIIRNGVSYQAPPQQQQQQQQQQQTQNQQVQKQNLKTETLSEREKNTDLNISKEIRLDMKDNYDENDKLHESGSKNNKCNNSQNPFLFALIIFFYSLAFAYLIGFGTDSKMVDDIGVFILAIFIGFFVVWNVTPALHTPLMSVTNAISGIITIGSIVTMSLKQNENAFYTDYCIIGFFGVFFATINVFGGFLVTHRMLQMFSHK